MLDRGQYKPDYHSLSCLGKAKTETEKNQNKAENPRSRKNHAKTKMGKQQTT